MASCGKRRIRKFLDNIVTCEYCLKNKRPEEQRLSLKDKANMNKAIKQINELAQYSLRKRITILKNEWWYWENDDLTESSKRTLVEKVKIKKLKTDNTDLVKLIDEPDDIICLSDDTSQTESITRKTTSSVCFYPLTLFEEEKIICKMIASLNKSFSTCRLIAEHEYSLCIRSYNIRHQSIAIISEHWFYLFIFRHSERLARIFPRWINDLEFLLNNSLQLSPIHICQIRSLIILFKHYND